MVAAAVDVEANPPLASFSYFSLVHMHLSAAFGFGLVLVSIMNCRMSMSTFFVVDSMIS